MPPSLASRFTAPLRVTLLGTLVGAPWVLGARLGPDEEHVMDSVVSLLMALAPLLAWFTVEPEPPPARTPGADAGAPLAVRFPFLAGGASGAAFFVLAFACVVASYVTWLRVTSGSVWFADDDPVQLAFGALYACVYVLLPVGLCARIVHAWPGRIVATLACFAVPYVLRHALPTGAPPGPPPAPFALTELGDPWEMIKMTSGGRIMHYARDDLMALVALAALGIALNVPRIARRWRALAPSSGAPA